MGQLLLTEAGQKIGLILDAVRRLAEEVAPGLLAAAETGIVPGDHGLTAQLLRLPEETAEFEAAVADDAGVWGQAGFVAGNEFFDDLALKFLPEIKSPEGDSQPPGYALGVVGSLGAPEGHGCADTAVTGLHHLICRHGAVHAAAHADQNFFGLHMPASFGKMIFSRVYQGGKGKSIEKNWSKNGNNLMSNLPRETIFMTEIAIILERNGNA